jgi:hypothetical protein
MPCNPSADFNLDRLRKATRCSCIDHRDKIERVATELLKRRTITPEMVAAAVASSRPPSVETQSWPAATSRRFAVIGSIPTRFTAKERASLGHHRQSALNATDCALLRCGGDRLDCDAASRLRYAPRCGRTKVGYGRCALPFLLRRYS